MIDVGWEEPEGHNDPPEGEVDADLCGWTYDHTLELHGQRDGIRTYICRECGAEIIEEDEL